MSLVEIATNPETKLRGVIASQNIPPFTLVSHYTGAQKNLDQQARIQAGIAKASKGKFLGSEYILENQTVLDPDGDPTILVPVFMSGPCAGQPKPQYSTSALFVNEPTAGTKQKMNAVLAPNYDNSSLTLLTIRDIKKGDELLVCYGTLFVRKYKDDKGQWQEYKTNCSEDEQFKPIFYYIYLANVVRMYREADHKHPPKIMRKMPGSRKLHFQWKNKEWVESTK